MILDFNRLDYHSVLHYNIFFKFFLLRFEKVITFVLIMKITTAYIASFIGASVALLN